MDNQSAYQKLRKINVNEFVEKKGKFNYLSWANAVDQLLLLDSTCRKINSGECCVYEIICLLGPSRFNRAIDDAAHPLDAVGPQGLL